MFNLIQLRRIAVFLGIAASSFSCSQDESLDELTGPPSTAGGSHDAINYATIEEQYQYTATHLNPLGAGAVAMLEDSRFTSLLYAALDASQDEDRSVLFSTLIARAQAEGWNLPAEMDHRLSMLGTYEGTISAMNSFMDLDSTDWSPRIYVPNYAELRATGMIGRTDNKRPAYVVYTGDESVATYPAKRVRYSYFTTRQGEIVNTSSIITAYTASETVAEQQEVLVVGLSEVPYDPTAAAIAVAQRPSDTQRAIGRVAIDQMKVKQHKESWLAGKSDVAINGNLRWKTPYSLNPTTTGPILCPIGSGPSCYAQYAEIFPIRTLLTRYDGNDNNSSLIRKFTRSEIRNGANINVDQSITAIWNPYYTNQSGDILLSYESSGEYGHYVIFEADPWPAVKRRVNWTLASENKQITEYRSSDEYYAIGSFSARAGEADYFEGNQVVNDAIEYTLKKKQ